MANINRVVLVGNLTSDPELRHTPSGTAVCSLRIAVNSRRRDETGQWVDKPNYFDVSVFGNQAEIERAVPDARAAPSASTAGSTGASGTRRTASKRQAVRSSPRASSSSAAAATTAEARSGGNQFVPAGAAAEAADFPAAADDDIPF